MGRKGCVRFAFIGKVGRRGRWDNWGVKLGGGRVWKGFFFVKKKQRNFHAGGLGGTWMGSGGP
jgi:hypothetical protein